MGLLIFPGGVLNAVYDGLLKESSQKYQEKKRICINFLPTRSKDIKSDKYDYEKRNGGIRRTA